MITGQCLCGDVTFTVNAPAKGPSSCHCKQCRRQSGHLWSSAYAPETAVDIQGPVAWYEASPSAKRGFCPRCGSFLFWKAHDEDTMSFALGAVNEPTGITLERHIFTADKGDYYVIADSLPQWERS